MKRICSVLLCLMITLALVLTAGAEKIPVQQGWATEAAALVFYGRPAEQASAVSGGVTLEVSVSTAEEENVPITYFCLVDAPSEFATWGNDKEPHQQIAALKQISVRMRSCDRMVLAVAGQKLTVTELSADKAEREAAIDAVLTNWDTTKGWRTNLYGNMVSLLGTLNDSTAYPGIRHLVVLSDGADRGQDGTSIADIAAAVSSSGVFVSWVGTLQPYPTSVRLNVLSQLEEACSGAVGGVFSSPNRDGVTASQSADLIVDMSIGASVIRVGTDLIPRTAETAELEMTLDGAAFRVSVPVAELPEVIVPETEPPTEPVEASVETTEPPVVVEEAASGFGDKVLFTVAGLDITERTVILIVAAAGALALIAIIVILSRIRRNIALARMESIDTESVFGENAENLNDAELQDRLHAGSRDIFEAAPQAAVETAEEPAGPVGPCRVGFASLRTGKLACRFELDPGVSVTVGRSTRAQVVLDPNDVGMSGVHFEVHWDGTALFLRDRNSTNGTLVNNIPQEPQQWVRLENGDEVGAGSNAYHVMIGAARQ